MTILYYSWYLKKMDTEHLHDPTGLMNWKRQGLQ